MRVTPITIITAPRRRTQNMLPVKPIRLENSPEKIESMPFERELSPSEARAYEEIA